MIADISEVLNIDTSLATTLLRHFRWRKELLLTAYLENPVKVSQQVGALPCATQPSASEGDLCSICGNDLDPKKDSVPCGHWYTLPYDWLLRSVVFVQNVGRIILL